MLSGARLLLLASLFSPLAALARHPGASRLIYLNRNGGEYTRGWPDDSRSNRASALEADRATLQPYPYDVGWGDIVTCVRDLFADFDVYVTDEDPKDASHVECVVGGDPRDIDQPVTYGGVAPGGCDVNENAIVFVFSSVFGGDPLHVCWVAGQEIGHAYGLDHVTLCADVMTYDDTCPDKWFTDEEAWCGETASRPCRCGGSRQNSHALLLERLGAHPPNAAPTVAIVAPSEGAVVEPGFAIEAEAADDRGVDYVRLEIDGEFVGTDGLEPWAFVAPEDLGDGPHALAVQALDYDGDSARDEVTVTLRGSAPDGPDGGGTGDAGDDARPERRAYGCGCEAIGHGPTGAVLLLFAAATAGRKR